MSEENVRTALVTAESVAPCVLWIDEIEKGLAGLGSSDMSDAGTTSRVFSSILTWLQEKDAPVFVAATANRISGLPPELLRRGRFDEIFFVDLPNASERSDILAIHLAKHGRIPDAYDLDVHGRASHGYTGAELEQVVVNGLFHAFEEHCELSDDHLARATEQTIPLSTSMAEEIERLQKWGHDRALNASPRP